MSMKFDMTSSIPIISCRARHPFLLFFVGMATGALLSAGFSFWLLTA